MNPTINGTGFGYIDVGEQRIKHDIYITLNGEIKKRKKKLSKAVYGTSHTISLAEAEHLYEDGAEHLLIGSGQFGRVELSPEAADYFQKRNLDVEIKPTPKAVKYWNQLNGRWIGLFHLTC